MARSMNMISIQQFDFFLLFFVCTCFCVYVCVVGGVLCVCVCCWWWWWGGGVPLNALLVLITGKSLLHS